MHPSLKLSNLSRLPIGLRHHAKEAAEGSFAGMRYIASTFNTLPQNQKLLLAPVFCSQLDTAHIPQYLEVSESSLLSEVLINLGSRIYLVLSSLRGLQFLISRILLPAPAVAIVWPRVWEWIVFLDNLWQQIPSFIVDQLQDQVLLRTLGAIRQDPDMYLATVLNNRQEYLPVVGSIWCRLASRHDVEFVGDLMLALTDDGRGENAMLTAHGLEGLDSLVSGMGGSRKTLAQLIVITMRRIYSNPPYDKQSGKVARSVVSASDASISIGAFTAMRVLMTQGRKAYPSFSSHLLHADIIPALAHATRIQAETTPSHFREPTLPAGGNLTQSSQTTMLHSLYVTLASTQKAPQKWFAQALEAGLLRAVLLSADVNARTDYSQDTLFGDITVQIFRYLLPAYSFYHSVLIPLHAAFKDVDDSNLDPEKILEPEIFFDWSLLRVHVEQLLAVDRRKKDSASRTHFRACDNMHSCGKILHKTQLKQCPHCLDRQYCDVTCQRMDWRGSHREQCSLLRVSTMEYRTLVSRQNHSFFRALIVSAFEEVKYTLSVDLVKFMATHNIPLYQTCVKFTFLRVYARDDLTSDFRIMNTSSQSPKGARFFGIFSHSFKRVRESNGKMQMHFLEVVHGSRDQNPQAPPLDPLLEEEEKEDGYDSEIDSGSEFELDDDFDSNLDSRRILIPMPLRFDSGQYSSKLEELAGLKATGGINETEFVAEVEKIVDGMGTWAYSN
ncbi:hypothetical protein MIND_00004100 [Mycena indigotica]|uniref:MYND-type domain-containing protein n=1 Tax=Mycena indigotica TaxID=2126181 RepID=A0A8H6TC07_9AGAR|nr:uncharacterized protein MIND_00004100 [Mycena indigotica]KAF7314903.1 hypothetical protein MIND_00004100 [Mycena indigotica]